MRTTQHWRLSVPDRGAMQRSERRAARGGAAGRAEIRSAVGGMADLPANIGDWGVFRPPDDCRIRPPCELYGRLEARPVERARHAHGTGACFVRARRPEPRPYR